MPVIVPWLNICSTAPFKSLGGEARHAEHDVAHMADAGVGDELFQIFLRHGAERAVDNIPRAQRAEKPVGEIGGRHRQHRES